MSDARNFHASLWDDITGPPEPASPGLRVTTGDDGIAVVELNSPPVNVLTVQVSDELYEWMRWLAVDPKTKAVLLTSAIADHFCAGGDLSQVVNPTPDGFHVFWTAAQKLWILFHAYRKPIATVVTGTAPGMGCALVLCSDYRVMVRGPQLKPSGGEAGHSDPRPFVIGFNEGAFGICLPSSYTDMYVDVVGLRTAERMLARGTMVTADEAAKLGIVDAAVDNKDAGVAAARSYLSSLLKVPSPAFAKQRQILREKYIKSFYTEEGREAEVQFMLESMTEPSAQAAIQAYLAHLSKRSKQPKA